MATLLEAFHAQCRSLGGTAGSLNGDFHAAADAGAIPAGTWSERILAYAQTVDSTIPTAAAAFNYFLQDPARLVLGPTWLLSGGTWNDSGTWSDSNVWEDA